MRSAFAAVLGTLLCLSTMGDASAIVCVPVSLGQLALAALGARRLVADKRDSPR